MTAVLAVDGDAAQANGRAARESGRRMGLICAALGCVVFSLMSTGCPPRELVVPPPMNSSPPPPPPYRPMPPGWLGPRPEPLPPRKAVVRQTKPAPSTRAEQVGTSVNGAPIYMHTFGTTGPTTLVFGGIHGDEENSSVMAERLVEHLRANPQFTANRRILVIPRANPDGLARGTRGNINKVDLNRNFPASNFKRSNRHGGQPLSEPESRAIAQVVNTHRPSLIFSLHSIANGAKCNNYDGPAQAIAQLMSRFNSYAAKGSIGYPTPGSFGSWAGKDKGIATITLEIPKSMPGNTGWAQNKEAILKAIERGA